LSLIPQRKNSSQFHPNNIIPSFFKCESVDKQAFKLKFHTAIITNKHPKVVVGPASQNASFLLNMLIIYNKIDFQDMVLKNVVGCAKNLLCTLIMGSRGLGGTHKKSLGKWNPLWAIRLQHTTERVSCGTKVRLGRGGLQAAATVPGLDNRDLNL
jgi:hypothetical protein